jgi:AraC-like DNA-binding protein
MSVTSLHHHFRAITSVSPVQYQKHLCLQAARTQLIAGTGRVAEIGFSVGYENPSQFNREYRRVFGHPPGRDAHKKGTNG